MMLMTKDKAGTTVRRRLQRVLFAAALAAPGALLVPSMVPTRAEATSTVCAAGDKVDFWCDHLSGSGGFVHSVLATGDQLTNVAQNICDYAAYVRVSAYGNPTYAEYWGSSDGGCSPIVGRIEIPIHRRFPRGSYVCTTYYVQRQQQGRVICIKLT